MRSLTGLLVLVFWASIAILPANAQQGQRGRRLSEGPQLFHFQQNRGTQQARRLENWQPNQSSVRFVWNLPNSSSASAIIWQVTRKKPLARRLTTADSTEQVVDLENTIALGTSEIQRGRYRGAEFTFDFSRYQNAVRDSAVDRYYVQAVPVNNLKDRILSGQVSNAIEVIPPADVNPVAPKAKTVRMKVLSPNQITANREIGQSFQEARLSSKVVLNLMRTAEQHVDNDECDCGNTHPRR